ncbi:hypothetical protein [Actinomadura sp. 9N215]|uniref:hypothetical protein n=1 Tax=Actinomadura sp. 9N215 TaxID=3375150 RepID=UPI0037AD3A05
MTAALAATPWPTLIAGGVALLLVAVVGLTIRSIIRGDLVPRQYLKDVQAERDTWREAWTVQQATIAEFRGQLEANTEALRFTQQLVEALAAKGPAR